MLGNVIPMANWEKYGDYVIGASLILVAAYFFLQESQHLVADADGNIVVAGCGCAQPHPATGTHAHHHGCSDSHHAARLQFASHMLQSRSRHSYKMLQEYKDMEKHRGLRQNRTC